MGLTGSHTGRGLVRLTDAQRLFASCCGVTAQALTVTSQPLSVPAHASSLTAQPASAHLELLSVD